VGVLLQAVDVAGRHRWRWLLVDERSGAVLADHQVDLDPRAAETAAFEDLYRFLRWRAEPDRRVASETELVSRVGAWIGSAALGEKVGRAIVAAAPVTVRVRNTNPRRFTGRSPPFSMTATSTVPRWFHGAESTGSCSGSSIGSLDVVEVTTALAGSFSVSRWFSSSS
jgi:hypothetical protein